MSEDKNAKTSGPAQTFQTLRSMTMPEQVRRDAWERQVESCLSELYRVPYPLLGPEYNFPSLAKLRDLARKPEETEG